VISVTLTEAAGVGLRPAALSLSCVSLGFPSFFSPSFPVSQDASPCLLSSSKFPKIADKHPKAYMVKKGKEIRNYLK